MKLLLLVLSAVPAFVRQVHAQLSPFVMMPCSFSTPAAALFLTLLVSDVAATLPDFEVVGTGACEDDQNRFYDYFLFQNGSGAVVTSKDDCARLCVPCACEVSVSNTNRQFRGFVYVPTALGQPACACYFDDDPSADFTGSECQNMNAGKCNPESQSAHVSDRSGTGVIDSSFTSATSECSRTVTTFSTEDCPIIKEDCPSEVPSESPVISPSESPSDAPVISPSESPSGAPSESPSDAPSKSASPTAKASKHPKGPKSSKMPKSSSSLQTQEMKSGGSPSFSPLSIVGVCGMFAVITFIFVDLI